MGTDPVWIATLREAVDRDGYEAVGRKIKYSRAVIDGVLKGTYGASTDRVKARVEGAFAMAMVTCPVIGDALNRSTCLQEQHRRLGGTSGLRERFKRTCPTCIHYMPAKRGNDDAQR
ncbi:MAG: XRE family transcriptional regulator [Desulfobulbaceae bacterium]|nr:MAG: XRE family transcriptional regulator [Desulfobulbaceae bacterium]